MKTKILLLSTALLIAVSITACLKPSTPAPAVLPAGNFTGTFTRYHHSLTTGKNDTVTAALTLSMSAATGFAVGGDTSKHAGSHGSYVADGTYIAFSDATLPSSSVTNAAPPAKIHLNGVYQYNFVSGASLQIQFSNDTLVYYYNMKAQ